MLMLIILKLKSCYDDDDDDVDDDDDHGNDVSYDNIIEYNLFVAKTLDGYIYAPHHSE